MPDWRVLVGEGVLIFTRDTCRFCHVAKNVMNRYGIKYREVNTNGWEAQEVESLRRDSGYNMFPNIWVGGYHVKGYLNFRTLLSTGQLFSLLDKHHIEYQAVDCSDKIKSSL